MTRTFAMMEVSPAAYLEIRAKMKVAGYDDAIDDDDDFGERIDMHGIAIGAGPISTEHLVTFVMRGIQDIESDDIYQQEPASVETNAPVALLQMGLKGKMHVLQKVKKLLGNPPPSWKTINTIFPSAPLSESDRAKIQKFIDEQIHGSSNYKTPIIVDQLEAFSIGRTSSYERGFDKDPDDMFKAVGGWAFETEADAWRFMARNSGCDYGDFVLDGKTFSVYGLILPNGWATDVDPIQNSDGSHTLTNPAKLIRIHHEADDSDPTG